MLVVDTTVWIDYFNGKVTPGTDYLDRAFTEELILVGDLILAETLQGFRTDKDFKRAVAALEKFEQRPMLSPTLAIQSAKNYRALRKKGVTVRKTIDCLIATYCIAEKHSLLHCDSDYGGFERYLELKVVHPK
jgi:predicted nucleic acid-binding protein